jgi:hypothetical protein
VAAMKPRTGSGPIEATKEARSYVIRVPMDDGSRLVVSFTLDEAKELAPRGLTPRSTRTHDHHPARLRR